MTAPARLVTRVQIEQEFSMPCSTIYHRLKTDPSFPKPIRTGKRSIRWEREALERWLQGCREASAA